MTIANTKKEEKGGGGGGGETTLPSRMLRLLIQNHVTYTQTHTCCESEEWASQKE